LISDKVINVKDNIYDIADDVSIREAILSIYEKFHGQYFDIVLRHKEEEIHVLKTSESIFIEGFICPLCGQKHKASIFDDKLFINCGEKQAYYIETDSETYVALKCLSCQKNLKKISFEDWQTYDPQNQYCSEHLPGENEQEAQEANVSSNDKIETVPRGTIQTTLEKYTLIHVPVNQLKTDRFQFRFKLDEEHVKQLAVSMKTKRADGSNLGNVEPILINQDFEVFSGFHRLAAAKLAELKTVECKQFSISDIEAIHLSLLSNFARKDMSHMEKARAIKEYQERSSKSLKEIAEELGLAYSTVKNLYRLNEADESIIVSLEKGVISFGHAKILIGLSKDQQRDFLQRIIDENLSVRATEDYIKQFKEDKNLSQFKYFLKYKGSYFLSLDQDFSSYTYFDDNAEITSYLIFLLTRVDREDKEEGGTYNLNEFYCFDTLSKKRLEDAASYLRLFLYLQLTKEENGGRISFEKIIELNDTYNWGLDDIFDKERYNTLSIHQLKGAFGYGELMRLLKHLGYELYFERETNKEKLELTDKSEELTKDDDLNTVEPESATPRKYIDDSNKIFADKIETEDKKVQIHKCAYCNEKIVSDSEIMEFNENGKAIYFHPDCCWNNLKDQHQEKIDLSRAPCDDCIIRPFQYPGAVYLPSCAFMNNLFEILEICTMTISK